VTKPTTTIFICSVCRQGDDAESRPGERLAEALRARLARETEEAIAVEPVLCLAVCKRPATVALACDGKWTYVIGDVDADRHVEEIIASAKAYAASSDGLVPKKDRPDCFKNGVISRTPPLGLRVEGA